MGAAAFLISGSYLASRLLGLLRDRLLAAHFGIGPLTDAYTAAFRLPELLFTLLVSGAFAVAFIPVLTTHIQKEEEEEVWQLSGAMLNLLVLVTIVVAVVIFIFADPLTKLIAPGFDTFRHQLTVKLTRIMLITPTLFAVSSVWGSIQQAYNRFMFYALASVFYNIGIIFGIVFLTRGSSIEGVAWGVVLGAGLQSLVQLVGLIGLGYKYRPSFHFHRRDVTKVVKLMIPRSIDQGIDQLNYTIQTIIGSGLAKGSLTAYYYANNLKNVPLVIFGSAIATAAFPRLASRAVGDREKLVEDFVYNSRLILFLVIPSATVAVILRGYIVRLLFGFGDPTTATTLGFFAGTIVFQSLFFLVARMYYALQDTKTPLFVSIGAITLNVILSFILSARFGVAGLAMAQSAVAFIETVFLLWLLRRKLGNVGQRSILTAGGRMMIANVIMGSVLYIVIARLLPLRAADIGFAVIAPKFAVILAIGMVAYFLPCYLLDLHEAKKVIAKLKAQFSRPVQLQ